MAKRSYTPAKKKKALKALEANGGNVSKTAKEQKVPRTSLIAWRDGKDKPVTKKKKVSKVTNEKVSTPDTPSTPQPTNKPEKFNDNQQRFCHEYLIDYNATKAAIRAGYSEKSAEQQGHHLLKKPQVKAYIEELKTKQLAKIDITAEKVLQELAVIGFSNINDFVDFGENGITIKDHSELPRNLLSAVSEVSESKGITGHSSVKFKLHDKLNALEKLAKHLKLYDEEGSSGPTTNNYTQINNYLGVK